MSTSAWMPVRDDAASAWKPVQQQSAPPTPPDSTWQSMKEAGGDVLNFVKGAGKGALHTISGTDEFARQHLPAALTNSNMGFGPPANLEHVKQMATPQGGAQNLGYGAEQVGEFLVPAGAEGKLASLAPKAVKPLARIATGALSSGLVNKAQGGDFSVGAATGAAGGAAGEGLRSLAPKIAESAIGIGKGDRAFGKAPGEAILRDTRGIRPSTIAESGQETLNRLTPQLESMIDAASSRPNRIRGLLPPPTEEIPLHSTPGRNPQLRPMAFDAKVNPEEPLEPRSGNQMAPISEYPGINPHYLSGSEHPEMSGRVPVPHGVMLRRPEILPPSAPIPSTIPTPSFSLRGARGEVGGAMDRAAAQNASSLHGQLGEMRDFLGHRFTTGEAIPENITPRQGLDLKRGFSKEFLGRWNPETHGDTIATGRKTYGQLDSELDRTVPEAGPLNQRISSLIPAVHRADSTARNAPMAQKVVGRFIAPTGALTAAAFGAGEGAKHGLGGAIAGGTMGLMTPLVAGTPEGQMLAARTFNSPATGRAIRAVGTPATQGLFNYFRAQKKGTGDQER